MGGKLWTDEEIKFIKDNYPRYGSKYCAEYTGRNYLSVQKKAEALGVKKIYHHTYIDSDGYWVYRAKRTDSAQRIHRIIMEKVIGRKLTKDEVVHHIDYNKLNNDVSNLQLMTRAEHIELHRNDVVAGQRAMLAQGLRVSLG